MIQMASVRYVTDWLAADVGGGVSRLNSYQAAVTRFAGDAAPPAIAVITDPYRKGNINSDLCARFQPPNAYPALYVMPDGPVPTEGEVGQTGGPRDSQVSLVMRYIVRSSDMGLSNQQAAYAMKALEQAMHAFFADDATGRAARGDGNAVGIGIIACDDGQADHPVFGKKAGMAYGPWKEALGDAVAVQAFSVMMLVRDSNP